MTGWLYVCLPRGATFALTIGDDGRCVLAPPIARWCAGRTSGWLMTYWRDRGARVDPFTDHPKV